MYLVGAFGSVPPAASRSTCRAPAHVCAGPAAPLNLRTALQPALPHVSVGWLPGDQSQRINEVLQRMQGRQQQQQDQQDQGHRHGEGSSPTTEAGQTQAPEPEVVCTWTVSVCMARCIHRADLSAALAPGLCALLQWS